MDGRKRPRMDEHLQLAGGEGISSLRLKGAGGMKKTDYLMFCNRCGLPRKIHEQIIREYFGMPIDGLYCENCGHCNKLPDHLRKIKDDLIKKPKSEKEKI